MKNSHFPVLKDLVLIGGGHSHAIVLKRFGMNPIPGVRLTMIARDVHTPYSGMLPGMIAGHYQFDDVHIDLGRLARFAGARLYHDEAIGLDLERRKVLCRNRPSASYDVVSIDIGATPAVRVAGAAEYAVPVKPIDTLLDRWESLRARAQRHSRSLKLGVVGAGAAGVELALAIQYALRPKASGGDAAVAVECHLFGADETVLPTHNRRTQAAFRRVLDERGVRLHLGSRVAEVQSDGLLTDDGVRYELDEVVWATEAGAQSWPGDSGLDVDAAGFICVSDVLQSTSHADVFAAGDIAAMVNHPREKAGVFAVRQGRPLDANLRRALRCQPLKRFAPQRRFLSIVSTGDQYAVASRGTWVFEGRWVWKWKDSIDRRFMRKISTLPEMKANDAPSPHLSRLAGPEVVRELSASAMRCGGCGCKVGAAVLDRVLSRIDPITREDVVVGLNGADDASVEYVPEGMVAVRTVDAFRPIVDDPYTFGRITANHCLGDIYAMGADPRTALAVVTVPVAPEEKLEQLLEELLTGAVEILNEAGTALVGGHTREGLETELGFALSGVAQPGQLLRKMGMQPGDRLVLTKPIGTGTLFAAHMRLQAKGRWIDAAVRSMMQSSRDAAACVRQHGATACTDVTGFGVIGHLLEMTRASRVDATVALANVPVLEGAAETAAAGFLSSLQPQNIRLRRAVANHDVATTMRGYPLLFDPQTAGGLLVSLPAAQADVCVVELRALGYVHAAVVGAVQPVTDRESPIRIEI